MKFEARGITVEENRCALEMGLGWSSTMKELEEKREISEKLSIQKRKSNKLLL